MYIPVYKRNVQNESITDLLKHLRKRVLSLSSFLAEKMAPTSGLQSYVIHEVTRKLAFCFALCFLAVKVERKYVSFLLTFFMK